MLHTVHGRRFVRFVHFTALSGSSVNTARCVWELSSVLDKMRQLSSLSPLVDVQNCPPTGDGHAWKH